MRKFFILMLFAMNMVYFNQAMASSPIDQTIIFNEEGGTTDEKKDGDKGGKDGEKSPDEEDCE